MDQHTEAVDDLDTQPQHVTCSVLWLFCVSCFVVYVNLILYALVNSNQFLQNLNLCWKLQGQDIFWQWITGSMALLVKIEQYDPEQEEWPQYIERLELFFEANDLTGDSKADKRRATFGHRTSTPQVIERHPCSCKAKRKEIWWASSQIFWALQSDTVRSHATLPFQLMHTPIKVQVEVDKVYISIEVDTGAFVSIMSTTSCGLGGA